MEQVIKIAIENGWEDGKVIPPSEHSHEYWQLLAIVRPEFWQALGKGLGWTGVAAYYMNDPKRTPKELWLFEWHRFIDHLAEGKDIESFFTSLIK